MGKELENITKMFWYQSKFLVYLNPVSSYCRILWTELLEFLGLLIFGDPHLYSTITTQEDNFSSEPALVQKVLPPKFSQLNFPFPCFYWNLPSAPAEAPSPGLSASVPPITLSLSCCLPSQPGTRATLCCAQTLSCVRLFVTPWTVPRQAPLSTGFCRREHWSGLPCPPPGDLPDPGIESVSLTSPALAGGFFTSRATREDWASWGAALTMSLFA